MTVHSVLNVRAAPEWGNSELYKYYERNGLGYGTVHLSYSSLLLSLYSGRLFASRNIGLSLSRVFFISKGYSSFT